MKHLSFIAIIFLISFVSYAQSVAINTDGTAANASAMLDVKSTTKGMLIPRMSTMERTGIVAPMVGLLVFDNTTQSFWYYKTTGWTQLITTGSTIGYWNAQGADIYNNNTGNVGIGTTTPATKLTLVTGINTNGWTHTGQVNGVDSIIVGEGIGGVSAAIGTSSNHAFRLNAGGQGRISIYPAEQVVVGDNNSGSYGKFSVVTPNNSFGISHISNEGNILATNIGGTSAGIGTFSHTNMRIFSNGVSCIFVAEATGYVGIGTDNPTYKLAVNGTNRAKEVLVESGWADYVFRKNYTLTPLADVEKFIRSYQHLPNIPSASEIGSKGLPIGETQKKMMEKIEELTLYMIEANKKIEKLERLIRQKK